MPYEKPRSLAVRILQARDERTLMTVHAPGFTRTLEFRGGICRTVTLNLHFMYARSIEWCKSHCEECSWRYTLTYYHAS